MQDREYKNRVEAILFTTGRFMDLEEISRLCGIASMGLLKDIVQEIKQEYEGGQGSLTILEENGRYKLNIKKQYSYLTSKLLTDCELDRPTQETLAIIAYKNPAMQSEIINIRGTTAYDHIKFLKENDFITAERLGRTRLLKLAPKFFDYFDIAEESLKAQLGKIGESFHEPQGPREEQSTLQPEEQSTPQTEEQNTPVEEEQAEEPSSGEEQEEKTTEEQQPDKEDHDLEDEDLN